MAEDLENLEDRDECSICCEEFPVPRYKTCTMLPCKHWFHTNCIVPWIQKIGTISCPYCRQSSEYDLDRYILDSIIVRYASKACRCFIFTSIDLDQIDYEINRMMEWIDWCNKNFENLYHRIYIIREANRDKFRDMFLESINSLVERRFLEKKDNKVIYLP